MRRSSLRRSRLARYLVYIPGMKTNEISGTAGSTQRDRRSRKRIVTKRNVLVAVVTAMVLFALINVASEMRPTSKKEFGELYEKLKTPLELPESMKPVAPIAEEPVADHQVSDPWSVDGYQRELALTDQAPALVPGEGVIEPLPQQTVAVDTPLAQQADPNQKSSRFKIVGGAQGVRLEAQ